MAEIVNVSPIENGVYQRKDVEVTFSPTFKVVTIRQGSHKVQVDGSFFTDVSTVMSRASDEQAAGEVRDAMILNTRGTSHALPTADWI